LPQKNIRISEQLAQAIENDTKHKGLQSENEWLTKACQHFLDCTKSDEQAAMKLIVLRYATSCIKCHKPIPDGQWALYGRGIGAVCMDCYIERVGDKATVAKFLKMRELSHVVKALKSEADRLADKTEVLVFADKLSELIKKDQELRELVMTYLRQPFVKDEERQILEDILRTETDEQTLLNDVAAFFEKRIKPKKWLQVPQEG